MKYTKIYHLSHLDLDGYGSQYMTRFLRKDNIDIEYFNANYDEVLENIKKIFKNIVLEYTKIKEENLFLKQNEKKSFPKILFLITDLSIDKKLAVKINNFLRGNTHIDLTIQVLDHHKTSIEVAEKNDWYLFNNKKCGSSLTADYVNKFHNNKELKENLIFVGKFIQSHDLWEKESPYFNFANFLSDIVFNLYFPDFLKNEKREFLCNYIFNFISFYKKEKNITVEKMEMVLPFILNTTLGMFIKNKNILNDKNIRTLYKLYYYQSELYSKIQNNFETLKINNLTFKILYNVEGGFFQYFSHYFLENNKNIDFLLKISENGNISLRSVNSNSDVGKIANLLTNGNGGGHFHASGGRIKFKEKIHSLEESVEEIKNIIKNL